MIVYEKIKKILQESLQPDVLEIVDDSVSHAGHAGARPGGQTHFKVVVISQKFAGMTPVARHRLVYNLLKEVMDGPVHALNIVTRTPAEAEKEKC